MVEGGCFAVSSQPPGQDGSGRGEGLSPGWVVPPAEAPGSLSPARPRTPPRTCSGLRPPEERERGRERNRERVLLPASGAHAWEPEAGGPQPVRAQAPARVRLRLPPASNPEAGPAPALLSGSSPCRATWAGGDCVATEDKPAGPCVGTQPRLCTNTSWDGTNQAAPGADGWKRRAGPINLPQ